jgi:hypothetical protein
MKIDTCALKNTKNIAFNSPTLGGEQFDAIYSKTDNLWHWTRRFWKDK